MWVVRERRMVCVETSRPSLEWLRSLVKTESFAGLVIARWRALRELWSRDEGSSPLTRQ